MSGNVAAAPFSGSALPAGSRESAGLAQRSARRLRRRIFTGIIGILVALLLIIVGSIMAYTGSSRLAAYEAAVRHTQRTQLQLTALLIALTDAETSVRGYVIAGDESFLEPYHQARTLIEPLEADLAELTRDDPQLSAEFRQLGPLVASRLALLAEQVQVRRERGAATAGELIAAGGGKRLHDLIRDHVSVMSGILAQRLALQQQHTSRTAEFVILVVIGGGLLCVLIPGIGIQRDLAARYQTELELLAARDRAEGADRVKSAFLATMSHELRTPLNSIIGFTGILLQRLAGPLTTEQARQLSMVQGSARHLLALINDVLDLSKIEAGELQIAADPFDLHALVERIGASVKPMAEHKRLQLEIQISPDVSTVIGDERRTGQILLNLLSNAIKFTDRGGVTLRVTALTEPAGNGIRIEVTDTGIGIRPEDIEGIFGAFRQVDSALTRQHDGTGLGLTICDRLVRLMGGRIEVQSTWQRGSTFTVLLPLRRPESP